MTPHQLLIPRVRCTAQSGAKEHYPGSPFEIGDILIKMEESGQGHYYMIGSPFDTVQQTTIDNNPHLFAHMPWYAERAVEDMPEYVKYNYPTHKGVYKVLSSKLTEDKGVVIKTEIFRWMFDVVSHYTPATLEEFKHFKSK